jgi:hypothetical protein
MNSKKLLLFILTSLAVLLILSGCSNAGILLELDPNPVEFTENQTSRELELTVTTEGFGSLSLNNLIIEVIDENDEIIFDDKKEIDITFPVIGEHSKTENYTLDLEKIFTPEEFDEYNSDETFAEFYRRVLQDESHTLRLTVTGSNDSSLTARINYN